MSAGLITGISSMATRAVLAELGRSYGAQSGREVAIRSLGGVDAARLVRDGEATDVVVLASGVMASLEAERHLVQGSRIDFAHSSVAMAVRAGQPQPGIESEEALREAILGAPRICISTGPSGDQLKRIWERWGVSGTVAPRLVQAPPGVSVGSLLARGDADLGFQQLSELLDVPGIAIVGRLPAEMNAVSVFTVGIARSGARGDEARALLAFLVSPDAREAKLRHGMEPA